LFVYGEKNDGISLLSARPIDQQIARDPSYEGSWVYQARRLIAARRPHENLLNQISCGLMTSPSAYIPLKTGTFGPERDFKIAGGIRRR